MEAVSQTTKAIRNNGKTSRVHRRRLYGANMKNRAARKSHVHYTQGGGPIVIPDPKSIGEKKANQGKSPDRASAIWKDLKGETQG